MGDLSDACSQIVVKCLSLARIGWPDILWSVNKLARAITNWPVLATNVQHVRSLSFISRVSTNNIARGKHCSTMPFVTVSRLWLCRRSWRFEIDLRWNIMRIRKPHVCSNKVDVQETDMRVTVQRKLRLSLSMKDCEWTEFPRLIFRTWSLMCCIQTQIRNRNSSRDDETRRLVKHPRSEGTHRVTRRFFRDILSCRTSILFLQTWILPIMELCFDIFEDNEAVIKMIIKGRSPAMRHVSRTHRDALDWLFDRINLDPKIQIKYIDSKNQLTDMLTKGNFTRDDWNHLLCLFNISHFSSTDCSEVMSKKNAKRFRWRKSHSKIEAEDEFGLAMQRKDSWCATFLLHQKARGKPRHESQFPLSPQTEQHHRAGRPVVFAQHTDRFIVEEEFSQFTDSVACCEYTLPTDEHVSEPKGWIRENTKIGPVLEVTTCYTQSKYGVEIRIRVCEQGPLSLVGEEFLMAWTSLVTNLNNNEQDNLEKCSSKNMR